jgi:hypothetical protein
MVVEVVAVVPAFEETAEVLAAALLAVAFAERLPQRVAVADDWQASDGQHVTHSLADRVAQIQVEDAIKAEVLVERTDARQIGAAADHQVVLERINLHFTPVDGRRRRLQFVEVAHVSGQQTKWTNGADWRIAQQREQARPHHASELHGWIHQRDERATAGTQADVAGGARTRVVVDPYQLHPIGLRGQRTQKTVGSWWSGGIHQHDFQIKIATVTHDALHAALHRGQVLRGLNHHVHWQLAPIGLQQSVWNSARRGHGTTKRIGRPARRGQTQVESQQSVEVSRQRGFLGRW